MSIIVADKEFRTLSDEFFVNGVKVLEAYLGDGTKVYPDEKRKYSGKCTEVVTKSCFYRYVNLAGTTTTANFIVTCTASVEIESDIYLYVDSSGRMQFWTAVSEIGSEAEAKITLEFALSGDEYPPAGMAYYPSGAHPPKPSWTRTNPSQVLGGTKLEMTAKYVIDSNRNLVQTLSPPYPEWIYRVSPLGPYMQETSRLPIQDARVWFDWYECDLTSVTEESMRRSEDGHGGYNTDVWEYETAKDVWSTPIVNPDSSGVGTTFSIYVEFTHATVEENE